MCTVEWWWWPAALRNHSPDSTASIVHWLIAACLRSIRRSVSLRVHHHVCSHTHVHKRKAQPANIHMLAFIARAGWQGLLAALACCVRRAKLEALGVELWGWNAAVEDAATNPMALKRTFGHTGGIRVKLYRDTAAWCPYCHKVSVHVVGCSQCATTAGSTAWAAVQPPQPSPPLV